MCNGYLITGINKNKINETNTEMSYQYMCYIWLPASFQQDCVERLSLFPSLISDYSWNGLCILYMQAPMPHIAVKSQDTVKSDTNSGTSESILKLVESKQICSFCQQPVTVCRPHNACFCYTISRCCYSEVFMPFSRFPSWTLLKNFPMFCVRPGDKAICC